MFSKIITSFLLYPPTSSVNYLTQLNPKRGDRTTEQFELEIHKITRPVSTGQIDRYVM